MAVFRAIEGKFASMRRDFGLGPNKKPASFEAGFLVVSEFSFKN